ncbi:ATP synthase subunit I [Nitrospira defluvii]|nr:ATP synthase subunit I [Nitrospira defluvii]
MDQPTDPPPSTPINREQFLTRSNAVLYRIERHSLLILGIAALAAFLYSRGLGLSLLVGGLMGMAHFRSLHRLFQKRMLDPSKKLNINFFYGVKLFLMVGLFFWAIQWKEISSWVMIAGFFLTTGSVLLESKRH